MADEEKPAEEEPKKKGKKGKKSKKGKGASKTTLYLAAFLTGAVVLLPTTVMMIFGLLPTIVAWIVDRRAEKYTATTIGIMNVCGLMPFMLELWNGKHSVDQAVHILTDPFALLVIYGSAFIGWLLTQSMPSVVGLTLNVQRDERMRQLKKRQKKLIEEWGNTITESATRHYTGDDDDEDTDVGEDTKA